MFNVYAAESNMEGGGYGLFKGLYPAKKNHKLTYYSGSQPNRAYWQADPRFLKLTGLPHPGTHAIRCSGLKDIIDGSYLRFDEDGCHWDIEQLMDEGVAQLANSVRGTGLVKNCELDRLQDPPHISLKTLGPVEPGEELYADYEHDSHMLETLCRSNAEGKAPWPDNLKPEILYQAISRVESDKYMKDLAAVMSKEDPETGEEPRKTRSNDDCRMYTLHVPRGPGTRLEKYFDCNGKVVHEQYMKYINVVVARSDHDSTRCGLFAVRDIPPRSEIWIPQDRNKKLKTFPGVLSAANLAARGDSGNAGVSGTRLVAKQLIRSKEEIVVAAS